MYDEVHGCMRFCEHLEGAGSLLDADNNAEGKHIMIPGMRGASAAAFDNEHVAF